MTINTPKPSESRRRFIAVIAGAISALLLGEKALAAKKPAPKKVTKKPVKKAPTKPVAKSTPTPKASPTSSPSASPSPSATASPTPTPSASPSQSPAVVAPPANAQALKVAGKNLTIADLAVGATTAATFPKNGATMAVLVTRLDQSNFVALRPVCTHAGGPVELVSGSLVCVWHNSRFNQRTGAVTNGPADSPLPKENVALYGDTVYYLP